MLCLGNLWEECCDCVGECSVWPSHRGYFQFLELVHQELKVPLPPTQDIFTRETILQVLEQFAHSTSPHFLFPHLRQGEGVEGVVRLWSHWDQLGPDIRGV